MSEFIEDRMNICSKICRACNIEKAFSDFYKAQPNKSTLRPNCKKCHNIKQSIYEKGVQEKHNLNKGNRNIPQFKICSSCNIEKNIKFVILFIFRF